jgi:hypothetical protein
MMLFLFLACSLTSVPIEQPTQLSALGSEAQANLILQVDEALNVVENDDSIDRLYALRDLLTEIKLLGKEDIDRLQLYVDQIIHIEKKNASQDFEIEMSFPDISNDEVRIDLSDEENIFKQEIETLYKQQNFTEVLSRIQQNPDLKSVVYPTFVEAREIYIKEQTEYIQQSYTKIVSGSNDVGENPAQKLYDLCVSLERQYPEGNLTVIVDIRYRLQKIVNINNSNR